MAKKWIDANLIADADLVPRDLWKYEDGMRKKPNFDKSKEVKKRKINKKFKYKR